MIVNGREVIDTSSLYDHRSTTTTIMTIMIFLSEKIGKKKTHNGIYTIEHLLSFIIYKVHIIFIKERKKKDFQITAIILRLVQYDRFFKIVQRQSVPTYRRVKDVCV